MDIMEYSHARSGAAAASFLLKHSFGSKAEETRSVHTCSAREGIDPLKERFRKIDVHPFARVILHFHKKVCLDIRGLAALSLGFDLLQVSRSGRLFASLLQCFQVQ